MRFAWVALSKWQDWRRFGGRFTVFSPDAISRPEDGVDSVHRQTCSAIETRRRAPLSEANYYGGGDSIVVNGMPTPRNRIRDDRIVFHQKPVDAGFVGPVGLENVSCRGGV